ALDPSSEYFDPKASDDKPIWYMVDVEFVEAFPRVVPLAQLKGTPGLESMAVAQRGSRLSITPVAEQEWTIVTALAYDSEP
ncbi:MAG: EVE domain-containing protein, partial [Actinomycetota bacterium]